MIEKFLGTATVLSSKDSLLRVNNVCSHFSLFFWCYANVSDQGDRCTACLISARSDVQSRLCVYVITWCDKNLYLNCTELETRAKQVPWGELLQTSTLTVDLLNIWSGGYQLIRDMGPAQVGDLCNKRQGLYSFVNYSSTYVHIRYIFSF